MQGVLSAEPAVLIHFKSVRIVFLVFHCVVIALLAFSACKCDFNSHNGTSRFTEIFFAFFEFNEKVNASLITAERYCTANATYCCPAESTIQYKVQPRLNGLFKNKKDLTEVM